MKDFAYERPTSLDDALVALSTNGARPLAGGTDLIPQLREGRREAQRIVDLKGIPGIGDIFPAEDGGLVIGAAAHATAIARNDAVKAAYPAVAQSVRLIGSLQVQNRASLGGNICNAAPSGDGIPAVIAHQARVRIASLSGTREEALEEFIRGPGRTSLEPGELLLAIVLPPAAPRSAAHYIRFTPRRELDIAIVGAAAWLRLDERGAIADARVVLASVGPVPIRATSAEQALRGERPTPTLFEAAGHAAAKDARPISDTRASAEYRRTLVAVLTTRALSECTSQIGSGMAAAHA